jgi:flagellar basal-body rod protein FlgB
MVEGEIYHMLAKVDEITYTLIKNSLNASAERSRVISNNIANVNTKGYKAYKLNFEENLKKSMQNGSINLTKTNVAHMNDESETTGYTIEKDNSTSMRLDGNNVDIDNEMTNLAANTILYNTLINQANSRISMRRYVINEGRR